MSDALIREVMKRIIAVDYKLTFLVNIMSQTLPPIEGQSLKALIQERTHQFVGTTCKSVTDQVLVEIRETIERHTADKPSPE